MGGIIAEAVVISRMRRPAAKIRSALVAMAALAPVPGFAADELTLQTARTLATPAPAAAPAASTPRPRGAAIGGLTAPAFSPLTLDTRPRRALFLRAHRIDADNA